MDEFKKIKCNNVNYRKGYIEVTPGIHGDNINLECWDINPDVDISSIELGDSNFPEDGVVGNTELELSIKEAKSLIKQLEQAINKVRADNA